MRKKLNIINKIKNDLRIFYFVKFKIKSIIEIHIFNEFFFVEFIFNLSSFVNFFMSISFSTIQKK